jgi:anionic cell wall polymer biosynthesis LytR-Cps2A-Psr (LCP) family protein
MPKKVIIIIAISLLAIILIIGGFFLYIKGSLKTSNFKFDKFEILSINDSTTSDKGIIDSLSSLAESSRLSGRKIRIMITGVDARLGSTCLHADANHLLTVSLDSGFIDIISIPRGTLAEAGLADSTGQNYLANVRACRGRGDYLKAVMNISGAEKIDYYVEFGFSQAVGLIELLGFGNNAVSTLRVLRSRKSFATGDYQRCYNQGQFIRQMILKHFQSLESGAGDILLYGALNLVDTDLPFDTAKMIVKALAKSKFPQSKNDVIVRLKPTYSQIVDFNFSDKKSLDTLHNYIVKHSPHDSTFTEEKTLEQMSQKMRNRLNERIEQAKKIEKSNPVAMKGILLQPYQQKAWLQVSSGAEREKLRQEIRRLLKNAYLSNNEIENAKEIDREISAERNAFHLFNIKPFYVCIPFAGYYLVKL